ncbi:Bug family tripartite tricarboxylate transporter substrate binding protein [Xylophilus sp.]|uniref:Bug family tripartite tricarboxylate transporter substrate binding protein n=1 Tax=Xylophilus sp. TaxID=2653893 RepID=UPI0013B6C7F6|nr:tripartite tricarboxylate transporter substrate binding protein [Xylophilus sp.]KAF1044222.1 MAG: hypothetical protein GAK38_03651 [Xylophilus sp.]
MTDEHLHGAACRPLTRRAAALLGAGAVLALAAGGTRADAPYPNRPIRLIVPFPPGGATDNVARLLAKTLAEDLGQPVVIDNRGGAGAIIGAEAAAKAEPDGYTLIYTTAGVHVVNPAIYPKLPYRPLENWSMVSLLVSVPLALTVTANSRFRTAQELIDYARQNPDKLTYGSAGNGTSLHQSGEMFKHATGTRILHVPYKGAGPAMNDFLGGQVDMMFSYVGSVLPGAKDGRLRLLAIGSPQRLPVVPDVPTVAEVAGKPGYDSDTWTGLAGPAGLPAPIVERLNKAAQRALARNRHYLTANGYVNLGGTPAQMNERIARALKTLTPLLAQLMTST